MSNVLIAGLGGIGKHHLESIIGYSKIKKIYIYDKKIKKIIDFKKQSPYKNKIHILKNLDKSNKKILFSIISTNSNVRYNLFKKLVVNFKIKYFIFEKIVFQKINEYQNTKNLIDKYNLKCWINCPRRSWKIFKTLKKEIKPKKKIKIYINGNNWGLLSNTVHFLDLFLFLTKTKNLKVYLEKLDNRIILSKRKGFIELTGKIKFINQNKDELILHDNPFKKNNDLIFKLKQDKYNYIYNQNSKINNFKPHYQSEETIKHAKNIIKNKNCSLPLYLDTFEFHQEFLKHILFFLKQKFPKNYNKLLIT